MILLLVDVQNLFYSVRDNFGTSARVDFGKLVDTAKANRDEDIRPIAYIAQYTETDGDKSIIGALRTIGYEVKIKQVKKHKGTFSKTDLDSEMILDAMDFATKDDVSTVVVASGDADFVPLYSKLRERNLRVEVLSFQDSLSGSLQHVVDEIRLLSRSILFDGGPNHVQSNQGSSSASGSEPEGSGERTP